MTKWGMDSHLELVDMARWRHAGPYFYSSYMYWEENIDVSCTFLWICSLNSEALNSSVFGLNRQLLRVTHHHQRKPRVKRELKGEIGLNNWIKEKASEVLSLHIQYLLFYGTVILEGYWWLAFLFSWTVILRCRPCMAVWSEKKHQNPVKAIGALAWWKICVWAHTCE